MIPPSRQCSVAKFVNEEVTKACLPQRVRHGSGLSRSSPSNTSSLASIKLSLLEIQIVGLLVNLREEWPGTCAAVLDQPGLVNIGSIGSYVSLVNSLSTPGHHWPRDGTS